MKKLKMFLNKNKGFTLVELLAVIAILSILVIIALPNIMQLFQDAKKSAFETEIKSLYKEAQNNWLRDNVLGSGEKTYSKCDDGCENNLDIEGGTELDYYISIKSNGKVSKFYATNNTYQYEYTGEELKVSDIKEIKTISELNEDEILSINRNEVIKGNESIAGGNANNNPVSFETDSWKTIQNAVKSNNTSAYSIGDTKTIDLGDFGVHTVRVANKSNPSECSNSGFSQTGCGFVVEFEDIITTHVMNPFNNNGTVNGDGNKGGWEYSSARQYLNNEIYNSLPTELKSVIIDTFVVSGYGARDNANFLTTDKLYYLSRVEVDGKSSSSYATDSPYSHQLDFYLNYGTNASVAVKKMDGVKSHWCLRTASKMSSYPQYYNIFFGIRPSDGRVEQYGACSGVSPAFRIG